MCPENFALSEGEEFGKSDQLFFLTNYLYNLSYFRPNSALEPDCKTPCCSICFIRETVGFLISLPPLLVFQISTIFNLFHLHSLHEFPSSLLSNFSISPLKVHEKETRKISNSNSCHTGNDVNTAKEMIYLFKIN